MMIRAVRGDLAAQNIDPAEAVLGRSGHGIGAGERCHEGASSWVALSGLARKFVGGVCPESCVGLAGGSPVGVAAKRPRSWWPAEGET